MSEYSLKKKRNIIINYAGNEDGYVSIELTTNNLKLLKIFDKRIDKLCDDVKEDMER